MFSYWPKMVITLCLCSHPAFKIVDLKIKMQFFFCEVLWRTIPERCSISEIMCVIDKYFSVCVHQPSDILGNSFVIASVTFLLVLLHILQVF